MMCSSQTKTGVHAGLLLPPDEMAIRAPYWQLVRSKQLTTVFRPGNRTSGRFRSYCPGGIVKLRLLENPGADWAYLAPQFADQYSYKVRILSQECIRYDHICDFHFNGSSPDVSSRESLRYHLGVIYNIALEDIIEVTRTTYEYLDPWPAMLVHKGT